MKYLIVIFFFSLLACKSDPKKENQEVIDKDEIIEKRNAGQELPRISAFPEPVLRTVTEAVASTIPRKDDWTLINTHTIEGAELSGVAAVKNDFLVYSDTISSTVTLLDINNGDKEVILDNCKVIYLNQRVARVIMAAVDRNSVFVFRGAPDLYSVELPVTINGLTALDGFRIDDWSLVDRGNNRIVLNKGKDHKIIGGSGQGPSEFNNPSCLRFLGANLYVSDTGNKRIQMFKIDGTYVKSFGEGELEKPGGIASDGELLFVCDEALDQIFIYNQDGKLFYKLDKDLEDPRDIFFLQGRLYVSDASGTIKVFTNSIYQS